MTAHFLRRVAALGLVASCTALASSCSLFRTSVPAEVTLGMHAATPAQVALAWLMATVTVVPLTKAIGDQILRRLISSGTEIALAWEPRGVAIWLVVTLAGSALASLWPARQAWRMSVREALTYE